MKNMMFALAALLILIQCSFSQDLTVTDGLIVHLQANDITDVPEGGEVSTWTDSSGVEDLVDGTVSSDPNASRPTWHAIAAAGRPAVRFTNDVLRTSRFELPDVSAGLTIFAVCTGDSSGTASTRVAQIGQYFGAGGKVLGLDVATKKTSGSGSGYRFNNGYAVTGSNNPLTTGLHIIAWQMPQNGQFKNALYYVDNTTPRTLSTNYPNRTVTFEQSENVLCLGTGIQSGSYVNGDYYNGYVAEMVVYNKQLTTVEITSVMNYLYFKYRASIIVADPTLISAPEGQSATVNISLNSRPDDVVAVYLEEVKASPADFNQIEFDPGALAFDPDDWNVPQPVRITAADDVLLETQIHTVSVIFLTVSGDPLFDMFAKEVKLDIYENECGRWISNNLPADE